MITVKGKAIQRLHEYGIFGGEDGEYILDLAEKIQIPLKENTCTIPILEKVYGIDPAKIEVIHHGVPPREKLKKKFGLENRTVISTFGLISPGKGLEYGIEADRHILV